MAKKQKKSELSVNNWVTKSNLLNEVRSNRMSISQMRFFTIYLSKINPKDIESRMVRFKLEEYTKIMQFKQTNTTRLIKTAEDLLNLKVTFWDKTGNYRSDGLVGFTMCQIFKRIKLEKDYNDEWFVTIDCHDDILKLLFDLQKYYFKYELWNALQLTSYNQQRMYELLKQYEIAGERTMTVKDLREWLGLKPEEYREWQNFKVRVLDSSKEALANYTDIKFTWEVTGKRGKGGKINALKFKIEKNNAYIRQLTLEEFILEQEPAENEYELEEFERETSSEDTLLPNFGRGLRADAGYAPNSAGITSDEYSLYDKRIGFLAEACKNEFSKQQIIVLYDLMTRKLSFTSSWDEIGLYDFLMRQYNYMNMQAEKTQIKYRYGYIKSVIEKELEIK
jgi:plasmid replication initiation protein